ncbi:MAG TPA: hypothetical protein VF070_29080 [Streptosporangiaceae bacterium]
MRMKKKAIGLTSAALISIASLSVVLPAQAAHANTSCQNDQYSSEDNPNSGVIQTGNGYFGWCHANGDTVRYYLELICPLQGSVNSPVASGTGDVSVYTTTVSCWLGAKPMEWILWDA